MSSPVYKPLPPHTHGTADLVGVYSVPKLPPRLDDYPDSFWQGDKGRSKFETQFIIADLIMDLTITAQQIANQTIIGDKIVDLTITAQQIANQTIVGTKIADLTITAQQIANQTIVGDKIAGLTITAAKIANQTIIGDKIADFTITARQIANQTITGANIANFTIEGVNIKNATITATQIGDATILGTNIAVETISASNIKKLEIKGGADGQIDIGTIAAVNIGNLAVTGEKIAIGAVTVEKIADDSITGIKIVGQAISVDKISPNVSSKTLEFLYTKFKEFSVYLDTNEKKSWGINVWTREIIEETKLRYRLRKLLGELKVSGASGSVWMDVYVVRGSETIQKDALGGEGDGLGGLLTLEMIDYESQANPNTVLATKSYAYDLRQKAGGGASNYALELRVVGAFPDAGYKRWRLYKDWGTDQDWSAYTYFLYDYWSFVSSVDRTIRVMIYAPDSSNYYYFEYVDTNPTADAMKMMKKKFTEMSTVGAPNLAQVRSVRWECLTNYVKVYFSIGRPFWVNVPIYPLQIKYPDVYTEVSEEMNILCDENERLKLYYYLGGAAIADFTAYLQYPSSDVRGISYLEGV